MLPDRTWAPFIDVLLLLVVVTSTSTSTGEAAQTKLQEERLAKALESTGVLDRSFAELSVNLSTKRNDAAQELRMLRCVGARCGPLPLPDSLVAFDNSALTAFCAGRTRVAVNGNSVDLAPELRLWVAHDAQLTRILPLRDALDAAVACPVLIMGVRP